MSVADIVDSAMSVGITRETSISRPENDTSPAHAESNNCCCCCAWLCSVAKCCRPLIFCWICWFTASCAAIWSFTDPSFPL